MVKGLVPQIWSQSSQREPWRGPRQLHCIKQLSGGVESPSEAVRSGFGGRIGCRTRVQGFAAVVEIQVWGRFEPETGAEGVKSEPFLRAIYEWAGSGEVVKVQGGTSGCGARVRPRRSCMGASGPKAGSEGRETRAKPPTGWWGALRRGCPVRWTQETGQAAKRESCS